jgi:hypothetical protein
MKVFAPLLLLVATTASADPKPPVKHTAAECEPVVQKVWPVIVEITKTSGKAMKDSDKAAAIAECKSQIAKDPVDETMTCVLAAADIAAVRKCVGAPDPNAVKKSEAQLQLNKMGKNSKVVFITNAKFVVGKSKQLPEKACCAQPNHKCAVTAAWAKDPVWAELDFQIDEANDFQYTYEGIAPGLSFHATATGDPGCTGKPVTYKLEGSVKDGNPIVNLIEPK